MLLPKTIRKVNPAWLVAWSMAHNIKPGPNLVFTSVFLTPDPYILEVL
jgi:hypothetical protein